MAGDVSSLECQVNAPAMPRDTLLLSNLSMRQLGTHPSLPVLWIFQLEWPKQCWDLQPSTPSCQELRMGRCLESGVPIPES